MGSANRSINLSDNSTLNNGLVIKNHHSSDSKNEGSNGKEQLYEIGERALESSLISPTDQFFDDIDRVNPAGESQAEQEDNEAKTSPKTSQEANGSLKSSDKLEKSSESTEYGTTSEENMMNMEYRNYTGFRRSFKFSSYFDTAEARENFTRKVSWEKLVSTGKAKLSSRQGTSFASEDFDSERSRIESDNNGLNAKLKIKLGISELEDHVKILKKVDELKSDLRGLFKETDEAIRSTHFEGKVPTKQNPSSLVPFSKQPNSSFFHYYNDQCKPCPHVICCRLQKERTVRRHCCPLSGGAPFVICHKCFNLLQLPADFLVSAKKINKLRCGTCSQVLLYSFRPRPQSKLQPPPKVRHPPSEENEPNLVAADQNSAL